MKQQQCNRKSVWFSLLMSLFISIIPLKLLANTSESSKVTIPSTSADIGLNYRNEANAN